MELKNLQWKNSNVKNGCLYCSTKKSQRDDLFVIKIFGVGIELHKSDLFKKTRLLTLAGSFKFNSVFLPLPADDYSF
jgi:hypothetical protein